MVIIYHGTNEDGSGFLGSCELQRDSVRQSLKVESNRCLGENGEKVEERRSGEVGGVGSSGEANAREAGTLLRPEWRCRGGYGHFTISILLHQDQIQ